MDKLLTVVIPSYNVEKTLQQTVESLLVPNYELRSMLDILIVNDGSKDGTLDLARKLEAENPGIVRVWDKENGGHGSTINVGIDHGYGKYIKVVDGDDWLETASFEKFLGELSETDADVVATDYYHYFMKTQEYQSVKSSELPYGRVLYFFDIYDKYTFFMCSLAVKTRLLRNQPYRIDEHCYYADVEFDTLVAIVIKTVLYVDLKLYVYRLQNAGQSVSVEGFMKHYLEHERIVFTLIVWYQSFVSAEKKQIDKISYIEKRVLHSSRGHYTIALDFPRMERRIFLEKLREYDQRLKKKDMKLYRMIGRKPFIKYLRIFDFSETFYAIDAGIKRMVKCFRKYRNHIKSRKEKRWKK